MGGGNFAPRCAQTLSHQILRHEAYLDPGGIHVGLFAFDHVKLEWHLKSRAVRSHHHACLQIEANLLMSIAVLDAFSNEVQDFSETGVGWKLNTHREASRKTAYQFVHITRVAPREQRSNHDIPAPGDLVNEHLKGREQYHKQG
jgi:hypothetical protein